ncbi:MAG: hypothetical protein HY077_08130 [Elusimicrobia bacterium]|nr:hypothetical protein [Elusimicrobiota bacterium]
MLSRHALLPALILCLASCATAEGSSSKDSKGGPGPGLSDQDLDQRRGALDVKLSTRAGKVKQQLDRIAGFQLKMEKERLDFERYIAEERKAFFLFLKSVRSEERDKELERFSDKQETAREDFDKKQLSDQKDWFREWIEKPWKSESLELEATAIPAAPAAAAVAPAPKGETAQTKKAKPAPVRHAVYKKKTSIKKKRSAHEPPAEAPSEPARMESSGGGSAPPPPSPAN